MNTEASFEMIRSANPRKTYAENNARSVQVKVRNSWAPQHLNPTIATSLSAERQWRQPFDLSAV